MGLIFCSSKVSIFSTNYHCFYESFGKISTSHQNLWGICTYVQILTIFLDSSQLIFSQTLGKPQEQVCNICGKTIQGSKSKLLKHVNERHKGIKDHVCHLCGAGFSRPSTLKYHTQRIHEHSGKYACQYCEFKTVLPKHLAIHVNSVHTKEIKYSCEECNFSCYTKGNLTAHVKTVHLKLKPHKCTVCPESFGRKNELEKHRSSTGH